MPTPNKPLALLQGHLTKEQKEARGTAEAALITGRQIQEWPEVRTAAAAHERFTEIIINLDAIGKNDALFEPVINRYCTIHAEVRQLEGMRKRLAASVRELDKQKKAGGIEYIAYLNEYSKLNGLIISCDKAMTTKRKMMFDIERDNLMTLCSALRSIPKKPEEKTESPMAAFLKKRAGENAT